MSETVGKITFGVDQNGQRYAFSGQHVIALPPTWDKVVRAAWDVVHHWDGYGTSEACEEAIRRLRQELEAFKG